MKVIIGVILVIGIIYFLNRSGIIGNIRFPIIRFGFTHKHTLSEAKQTYTLYNGINKYPFMLTKTCHLTLNYKVTNKKGSLIIKFVDGNNVVFNKEFTTEGEGAFTYTPNSHMQIVTFIGSFAQGSCEVEVIKNTVN